MNLPKYTLHKPDNYKFKKQVFNHLIFTKNNKKTIVPMSFSKETINPKNFFMLKRKLNIQSILIIDRIKPQKKTKCIINHINRSGYNFLIGKTPFLNLPTFPDMSNLYKPITNLETIIVHTVGPDRFSIIDNDNHIISESVGLIAPIWHYVGVGVFAQTPDS